MKKDLIQTLKILLAATVLSLGISYVYAWTAPPQTPPAGNTPAPLNVGDNTQFKDGNLVINNSATPFTTGLIVANGNVGIGAPNPAEKLTVTGNVYATGNMTVSGKMNAPIFYDANDTDYYIKPSTKSNFNIVKTKTLKFADGTIQDTAARADSCATYTGSGWRSASATCGAGRTIRGGGCNSSNGSNGYGSYPSGNNWECRWGDGNSITAYAICCK